MFYACASYKPEHLLKHYNIHIDSFIYASLSMHHIAVDIYPYAYRHI